MYLVDRCQYVRAGSTTSTLAEIVCGVQQEENRSSYRFSSCCTLPTYCHWSRIMVFVHICMLTIRRYMDWILSTVCITTVSERHLWLHWWCCCMDAFKQAAAEYNEDRDDLVYDQSPFSLTTSVNLRVGSDYVEPASVVHDLGIYIDLDVFMRSHIAKTVSACFAVLCQLHSICQSLSRSVLQLLMSSLVLSWLNYSNTTLAGIPLYLLQQLQSVQNSAARLMFSSLRYDQLTTSLRFSANCTGWEHQRGFSPSLLFSCTSVCTGQHRHISLMSSSTQLISGPGDAFVLPPHCRWMSLVHGCPPLAIGPSLTLLPVLGAVCRNMSCLHPLCLIPSSTQGFPLQAYLPMTFTATFVVPAQWQLSFSDTLIILFYLLFYFTWLTLLQPDYFGWHWPILFWSLAAKMTPSPTIIVNNNDNIIVSR